MKTTISGSTGFSGKAALRKALLACGVLSSLLYVAMNIFIPMQWEEYSMVSQTVSELSAIGAPTRPVWFAWGIVYALLAAFFGWGVWQSAGQNRPLRIMGALLLADGIVSLFWPPMNMRGAEMAMTDILHIVFSFIWLILALLTLGFGIAAFRDRFRLYTIASLVLFIVFGILTGTEAPNVAKNLPTPRIGIWERINIAVFMLWVAVLAVVLMRKDFSKVKT